MKALIGRLCFWIVVAMLITALVSLLSLSFYTNWRGSAIIMGISIAFTSLAIIAKKWS